MPQDDSALHDNSAPQHDMFMRELAPAPIPPTPWMSAEPGAATEWRFGDLTLIRDVRRAGQPVSGLLRAPRSRRQACVALLCGGADDWSTLIVSPRVGLALATLEQSAHRFVTNEERLALCMPREWLEGLNATAAPVHRLDTRIGPGALLAGFMHQLASQSPHIHADQAKKLAIATRALIEACIAPVGEAAAQASPGLASSTVERARLMVQRHMASPDFGPPQLGRLLAMSRSKLYRLLDGDGGVAHFINRERLSLARQSLVAPGEPLSVHAIANQVGFRDHSTFSRAFRREYGCSPTDFRSRAPLAPEDPTRGPCPCERRRENGMNSPDLGF
ncbi:hypothetical protein IP69_10420 [Bosea sp. AAP35]|nr:hypothetical protein IP69_10420 [Bosea sp. AAP35]